MRIGDPMKKKFKNLGFILIILSAFFYAFNAIIEKKYISLISSEMILFLMYFGSGFGLFIIHFLTRRKVKKRITKKEVPLIICIVICELLASFFIIEAVKLVDVSLVSLLSSFEIILTAVCSYFIFKEPIGKNEMISMFLMIFGCFLLNFKEGSISTINTSSILVILACFCWGLENNITSLISDREPAYFTGIKCLSVSLLYFILVWIKGSFDFSYPILMIYGFFTYGLAILFYALSTRTLGANKATLIFSFSPIFGVLLAILFYHEKLTISFLISMILMLIAILLLNTNQEESESDEGT